MSAPVPATASAPQAPLFSSPIPIIGVTGEYASGKTLFSLTIAPGPRTRVYDTEKSAESYQALGFDRVDVPREMQRKCPRGYKPVDTFAWWRDHVLGIPAGAFDVVVLDVANDIETGAVDWVRQNPGYFSRTAAQYVKMSGLLWGDMKELWKTVLADIASRCQTFVFAVHMGDVWAGDKPSGKRKPRGKSTLFELASLYLQMERPKDSRGAIQAVPSAIVLKSRLAHTSIEAKTGLVEIVPALPPRLPVATPAAIRNYLANPPNYGKLKGEERAPEREITDDDRAAVRLATAEAEAEAERLRLERIDRQQQGERRAEERREQTGQRQQERQQPRMLPSGAPPTEYLPATTNGSHPKAEPATPMLAASPSPSPSPTSAANPSPTKATHPQLEQLQALRAEVFGLMGINGDRDQVVAKWKEILEKRGVQSAHDLTPEQAEALIASLRTRAEQLHAQRRGPAEAEARF